MPPSESSGSDAVCEAALKIDALLAGGAPDRTQVRKNVLAGKTYTLSRPAGSGDDYADPEGKKLTDGAYAEQFNTYSWTGFAGGTPVAVDFDLGDDAHGISDIEIGCLRQMEYGIGLAGSVTLYASADGESYTSLGAVYMPASPQDPAKFTYAFRLDETLKARYIRLAFSKQEAGWFFIDEISAYAYSADNAPEQGTVAQYYGDPTVPASEPSYWPETDADYDETLNLALGAEHIYVQHFSELEPKDAVSSLNTPDPSILTDGTRVGASWDSADTFRMTRGDGRRITIDLGHISAVERVAFDLLILTAWGVYPVGEVGVLVSENGADWQSVATVWVDYGDKTAEMLRFTADLGGVRRARYVCLLMQTKGHAAMSEIEVYGTKRVPDSALPVEPERSVENALSDRYPAPEDFGGLLHYLKRRGFSEEELETSGLVKRSAKGNLYDIFRHRVMVPIIDVRGAIIAFGGRVLDDSKPKYINSPETMVYHKSRTLFALNIAKKSKNRRYILCEGYMDVISMHEAGFDTAVCACGTALTPEQAKLLSEYADEVVLSYDSDEAGQKATERSLGILGSTTLKVSVLSYQGAKDPDEFIKKYGRERFEMLLNGTANPTEFQLKKSKAKYDLRSDDGRLSYIREAIEILTERGVSPTARDVYAGRLADETGVSKQAILSQLNGALQAAARRSYRKEQRDLSKEGIASDIRVPYTSSGESALGAANAARQLAVAMLQDPEQVPYVRARLDMSTVLVPEMQRALEAIFRCVDEHLPLNQTSLQQMMDEAAFQQLAHGQAYNHDIRLQRQDIDMYLDRLQTAKPISEQVKGMSDGQLESYFANLGKKKGARPAETDE